MATFTTYAEVLTHEHPQMKAYLAGIKKSPPGRLIRDVLQDTGGAYEITLRMSPRFQEKVRNAAELTKDETLRRVASQPEVIVPFEHLRHLDPDTTTIVLGFRLDCAPGEADRLGLGHEGPFDPRHTVFRAQTAALTGLLRALAAAYLVAALAVMPLAKPGQWRMVTVIAKLGRAIPIKAASTIVVATAARHLSDPASGRTTTPPGREPAISALWSLLSRPVAWLRAGYPRRAPEHGYIPLIALMPAKAKDDSPAGGETPPHPAEPPHPD